MPRPIAALVSSVRPFSPQHDIVFVRLSLPGLPSFRFQCFLKLVQLFLFSLISGLDVHGHITCLHCSLMDVVIFFSKALGLSCQPGFLRLQTKFSARHPCIASRNFQSPSLSPSITSFAVEQDSRLVNGTKSQCRWGAACLRDQCGNDILFRHTFPLAP